MSKKMEAPSRRDIIYYVRTFRRNVSLLTLTSHTLIAFSELRFRAKDTIAS